MDSKERMFKIRKERIEKGLCPYCGNPIDREGYCCKYCNKYHHKLNRERAIRNIENNRCSSCGKTLDREGWFCISCAKKLNNRATIRSAERREKNLCVQCGTPTDGYSYCKRCRDMRMAKYYAKKDKR